MGPHCWARLSLAVLARPFDIDAELADLRRTHRNVPELRSHQYVPAKGSVTGWIVTTMARPPLGGTPRLTVSVREAVGHQYLMIVPRTDPKVYGSRPNR